jgi:hypothetical protein
MTNRQTKLDVGVTQRDFFKTQRYFFKNRRFFPLSRLPFFVCQYVTPLLHPSHPQKQGVRPVFIGDVTPVHPFFCFSLFVVFYPFSICTFFLPENIPFYVALP